MVKVASTGAPLGKAPGVKDTPRRHSPPRAPQLVVERGSAHTPAPGPALCLTFLLLLTLMPLPWHLL